MVSYFFHLLILHRPLEGKFFFSGYSLALMYNIALQLYPLPMFVYGCPHMRLLLPPFRHLSVAFLPCLYYLLRARARRPKQVVLLAVR